MATGGGGGPGRAAAELSLAQAQRDELLSVVLLYRALGGGWQP